MKEARTDLRRPWGRPLLWTLPKGMGNRKTTRNSSASESITSTSCSPRDGTDALQGFELLRQMFKMRTEREKERDSIAPTTHARTTWEEQQRSIRILRRRGRGAAASCTEGGLSDNEFSGPN